MTDRDFYPLLSESRSCFAGCFCPRESPFLFRSSGDGGGGLEADKTEIILSGSVSGTLQPCVKFQVQGRINEIKRKRNIKLYVRGIAGREGTRKITWLRLKPKRHFQPQQKLFWPQQSFDREALLARRNHPGCSEGDCISAFPKIKTKKNLKKTAERSMQQRS